jgi:hypothetical protein
MMGRAVLGSMKRIGRIKLVAGGVVMLAVGMAALVSVWARPVVSLTVVGVTTNAWEATEVKPGQQEYGTVVVAMTNLSQQTFKFTSFPLGSPVYTVLQETSLGWVEPEFGLTCGNGLQERSLSPAEGIVFKALVPADKACKVAVDYSDGRPRSPHWDKLPYWMVRRIPWAKTWRTAASEAIDLRVERE